MAFYEKEIRDLEIGRESFQYLFVSEGSFKFKDREWKAGQSVFLPADSGSLEIESLSEFAEMISVSWP